MTNFLSNSLKFSPQFGKIIVGLKVRETIEAHQHQIEQPGLNENLKVLYIKFDLTIQDFGCGIAPENIDKLFIDFSKLLESAAQDMHGVGLGLSICKQLLTRMDGVVSVESNERVGTTFRITFMTTCVIPRN